MLRVSGPRSENSIQAVECRNPVGLGHGRVIEGRLDEVVQSVARSWLGHDRLADMDDLGCLLAEAVDPQDFERVHMEQDLDHADSVAGDLRPGDTAKKGSPNLVGDLPFGQFPLGRPYGTDFRAGIDAVGIFSIKVESHLPSTRWVAAKRPWS